MEQGLHGGESEIRGTVYSQNNARQQTQCLSPSMKKTRAAEISPQGGDFRGTESNIKAKTSYGH